MQDIQLIGVPHMEVLNAIQCLPMSGEWNRIVIMVTEGSGGEDIHTMLWAEIDIALDAPRFHMLQSFSLIMLDAPGLGSIMVEQGLPLANARGILNL
jgi:hypothetical protein